MQAPSDRKYDDVDKILAKMEGKIEKKPDSRMCHHNSNSKCPHCLPLDPYDEGYLRENNIKHLSFHAYVHKLTDLHGKGTKLKKPLENVVCTVKKNCPSGHQSYPSGICTKCRPSNLTLMRQVFRHVDNIKVENHSVVDRFLDYWRKSSNQRIGYLIGSYQHFTDVPLGIKAVVAAIYEPPQESSKEMLRLVDDSEEALVDELCGWLGMKRVGWIFTDLWSADPRTGTVHCVRHADSFLLSAHECITAGQLQSKYKNYTDFCSDGHFGSKFVTVVASGDAENQIHLSGYQVSNQCAAMVAANILCPTNRPELAWVRDKPVEQSQYLIDVTYTEKNEYGAEVRRDGRPMPIEYLLVDVPTGFPTQPLTSFTISPNPTNAFPIENRQPVQTQDLTYVARYIAQFQPDQVLTTVSDFHLLLFLLLNRHVPFPKDEVRQIAEIVARKDEVAAREWANQSDNWKRLGALLNQDQGPAQEPAQGEGGAVWACPHCTFENEDPARIDCVVCNLPRDLPLQNQV